MSYRCVETGEKGEDVLGELLTESDDENYVRGEVQFNREYVCI